jgi:hypothetical protein
LIDVIAVVLILGILADDDRTFGRLLAVAILWFIVKAVIL